VAKADLALCHRKRKRNGLSRKRELAVTVNVTGMGRSLPVDSLVRRYGQGNYRSVSGRS